MIAGLQRAWIVLKAKLAGHGIMGFKGDLGAKVIRAHPTKLQRITDFLRGLT